MGMSQDEIDKLMADMSAGAALAKEQPSSNPEKENEIFKKVASLYSDAIKNIVPILVGSNDISITASLPLTGTLGDLISSKQQNTVFLTFKIPSLVQGAFISWIDIPLAIEIANKMMGQTDVKVLNEIILSALNEAAGNILGAFDSFLKEEYRLPVEHSDLRIIASDFSEVIQSETGLQAASRICFIPMNMKIGEVRGGIGFLTDFDSLSVLFEKHPSSQKPSVAVPKTKLEPDQQSEAAGRTAIPYESKPPAPEITVAKFEELTPRRTFGEPRGIERIYDVPLNVTVELGRKKLSVKEILDLVPGSLVELEKLAGEAVDLYVNGKLFAKGEVVVIDENFGVRITSIVTPRERVENLK